MYNISKPHIQGVPDVRLCLPHRGQPGGGDPRPPDHRVPRPRRPVLLGYRRAAPPEALHLGVCPAQPQQHRAVQEEAHLVRGPGLRGRMVGHAPRHRGLIAHQTRWVLIRAVKRHFNFRSF